MEDWAEGRHTTGKGFLRALVRCRYSSEELSEDLLGGREIAGDGNSRTRPRDSQCQYTTDRRHTCIDLRSRQSGGSLMQIVPKALSWQSNESNRSERLLQRVRMSPLMVILDNNKSFPPCNLPFVFQWCVTDRTP